MGRMLELFDHDKVLHLTVIKQNAAIFMIPICADGDDQVA